VSHVARGPLHIPTTVRVEPEESGADPFVDRECYVFNHALRIGLDDARCSHCRHYLTAACPHIDEFLEDVEELSPE